MPEIYRRIVAAAALNGWEFKDLPAQLEAIDAPTTLAGRVARGDKDAGQTDRRIVADLLQVPVGFLTAEDWRSYIRPPGSLTSAEIVSLVMTMPRPSLDALAAAIDARIEAEIDEPDQPEGP